MLKTIILVVAVAATSAVAAIAESADKNAQINDYQNDLKPDGTYSYRYESSNGIAANENGLGGYSSGGSAQWISPEGIPILLRYEADANGYRAFGDHIPTAHPIPDYILKSIEENRIAAADRAAKGIPDEY